MLVICGHCKTHIAEYQKVGKGNLLRMKVERVIKSSIDLSRLKEELICPYCNEILGIKSIEKGTNKIEYIMKRSMYNTKII